MFKFLMNLKAVTPCSTSSAVAISISSIPTSTFSPSSSITFCSSVALCSSALLVLYGYIDENVLYDRDTVRRRRPPRHPRNRENPENRGGHPAIPMVNLLTTKLKTLHPPS
ncbi:hypothetical protein GQX74_011336 [Glossina fuscipes]|nr:hypothetical protein GQX74_011336 [Glossina fuscipes]